MTVLPAGAAGRLARTAMLAGAIAVLAGCASLADRIAEPRTDSGAAKLDVDAMEKAKGIARATFAARDGNRLVYRVVPAADYGMDYVFTRTPRDATHGEIDAFHFTLHGSPGPVQARGTIVFLHGWGEGHNTMLPWALAFARHGYTGIVPDLRNHGQSDRAPAGYGPREARDIVDLLAMLRRSGQLQGPVYLFGESYGATTAVFAAADPAARVEGVIAMEPFVNAGKAIREMTAFVAKKRAEAGMLAALVLPGIDDPRKVDAAIVEAGKRLNLDLDAVDIGPLLRRGATCTALLTGSHDGILDAADLRALQDAPHVRYLELPDENHFSLILRIDRLADPLADWLAHAGACPPLQPPPEAAAAAR